MTYCLAIRLDEGLVFLADPPYDGGVLPNNGSRELRELRVEADSVTIEQLQALWQKHLHNVITELPDVAPDVVASPD